MTNEAYCPFVADFLAMDAMAVPCAHLFISLYLLGLTDNTEAPTSPQVRPFPLKGEAENIHAVSHVLLSQFFPLPQESSHLSDARFAELDEQLSQHVERSLFDPKHSFIAVYQTTQTRFTK